MATANKPAPTGVYKNLRFMHVSTSAVGCTVHLQTKNGSIWEGIFSTFNSEFTICLEWAVQIDPKFNSRDCLYQTLKNGAKAQEKAFFDLKDIVRITIVDVDLNAIKEMDKLATDNDISGHNSSKTPGEQRGLVGWHDDDGDNVNEDSLMSLDEMVAANKNGSQNNSRTGWDAEEMFELNKRKFKVNSTYDESLRDYTIAAPKPGKQDKDWRKKQERAAAIAREIETNSQSQARLAKEDGSDDEEEKFSAVVRPTVDQKPAQQLQHQQPQQSQQQAHQQQPQHQPQLQHQHQNQSQQGPQAQTDHPQSTPSSTTISSSLQHQHSQSQQQQQSHQQAQSHQQQQLMHQHQNPHHPQQNLPQRQIPNRVNNGAHKNLRPRFTNQRYESNINSLKNFNRQFHMTPSPRHPQNQAPHQLQGNPPNSQNQPSPQQSHHKQQPPQQQQQPHQPQQQQQQQHQPQHQHQQQSQQQQHQQHLQQPNKLIHLTPTQQHQQNQPHTPQPVQQQPTHQPPMQQANHQHAVPPPPPTVTQTNQHPNAQNQAAQHNQSPLQQVNATPVSSTKITTSAADTSTASERSDTSTSLSTSNQPKDQSEIAKNSKLNPNAKEFVYKPRSPAASTHVAQTNGASNPAVTIDPANSSPMSQPAHGAYYQQVPIFSHGLPPHQQQHHPAQFMPNHPHMHFQSQIHYMPTPLAPHFAPQQMSPRYIRGNFQNYHHRNGDHMNNVRAAYSQSPMVAPTSAAGQTYVPSPSGGPPPHPMNAYAAGSPQQAMMYGGPQPQSVYPMVPTAGFPQHMPHVPNPPPYDGSQYIPPTQNYVVNQ